MNILAIESSARAASCAVLREGELLCRADQATGLTHSRTLMPMVASMLENAELKPEDMDVFAVAAGPGSFTGLRIGVAAVKGLGWALEKPCAAVSTLEAMAAPLAHLDAVVICAMDARRNQIYNALFRTRGGRWERKAPDRAIALEELAAELKGPYRTPPGFPQIVVGDGAALCRDYLISQGIACELAPRHLRLQSAVGVAMAAWPMVQAGQVCTAQALRPAYLRLSQAERERLEREQGKGGDI